jgi:transcriptional regulator with XRE-family HTH domain
MNYGKRLEKSIELAKSSRKAVAKAAGVSVQAIGQVIRGETSALTAENHVRAARFLEIDSFWLATGEGKPRPDSVWPFESFLPSQYHALDKSLKLEIEDRLVGAIMRQDRQTGTDN